MIASPLSPDDPFSGDRSKMVEEQIEKRGIRNSELLTVLRSTPRHLFIPKHLLADAYRDSPIPIGEGQTISQPYMVALMTENLDLTHDCKVLEIGTGSGYQTAILSQLAKTVYSVELNQNLLNLAKQRLDALGFRNIITRLGDGWEGWGSKASFDRIIVTASPPEVPQILIDQLSDGGKMVIPAGPAHDQKLYVILKKQGKIIYKEISRVSFVPLVKPNH